MQTSSSPFLQGRSCALCMLLFSVLCWAGNVVVARAFHDNLPPLWLTVVRWGLASLLLLPLSARALLRQYRGLWACKGLLLWLAATGIAANNACIYFGTARAGATSAAALQTLTPVWIVLFGALRGRLTLARWSGVLLALAGALWIAGHGEAETLASALARDGGGWLLAASLCWAVYTLAMRRLPESLDPGAILAVQAILGAILLLPFAILYEPAFSPALLGGTDWLALVYLGVFPSVLAYAFYRRGADRLGADFAASCMNLMPALSAFLSVLFLGEHLQVFHVAGFVMIMTGLALGSGMRWRMPGMA